MAKEAPLTDQVNDPKKITSNHNGLRKRLQRHSLTESTVINSDELVENNDSDVEVRDRPVEMCWEENFRLDDVSASHARPLIASFLEKDFPTKDRIPCLRDLINVGKKESNGARYARGDWVEFRGPSMKWRLDMITRVTKEAPDDHDWNKKTNVDPVWKFYYDAGSKRRLKEENLRSPEEGLKFVFGTRPWIWQKWAMLKLEKKLRFQEGHQDDFVTFDVQKYIIDLWNEWISNPLNEEFRNLYYDEKIGDYGRSELMKHIFQPFRIIDLVSEGSGEYNLDAATNISVYTYLSFIGSGIAVPILTLFVQVAMPLILMLNYSSVFEISLDQCDKNDNIRQSKLLALFVLILYCFTVVPNAFLGLYNIAGPADTMYSRLVSLRVRLYMQGNDTRLQILGYKLDLYMNTIYSYVLSMINILVVLRTKNLIDIILNAIAFQFLADIDELVTSPYWWDFKRRWIKAGIVEVIMQESILLNSLEFTSDFCQNYEINKDEILDICGSEILLRNAALASVDDNNLKYLSDEDQLENLCKQIAAETKNYNAFKEYDKGDTYYGYLESLLGFSFITYPVFQRFKDYRTWSMWEKILYLAKVPKIENNFFECNKSKFLTKLNEKSSKDKPFKNFFPEKEGKSFSATFFRNTLETMAISSMKNFWSINWKRKQIGMILFHLVDGVLHIFANTMIIIFPVYVLLSFYEVIYALITEDWCYSIIKDIYNNMTNQ